MKMSQQPALFVDVGDAADAAADAEGLADLEAERVVSGEAVKLWLRS
jgi:hypothetical protein